MRNNMSGKNGILEMDEAVPDQKMKEYQSCFQSELFGTEVIYVKLIKKLKHKHMIEVKQLDFGGGFDVRYTDEDKPSSIREVCPRIIGKCEKELRERKGPLRSKKRKLSGSNAFRNG